MTFLDNFAECCSWSS